MPGAACIQHFTLRFVLWCYGMAPWRYVRFLNFATDQLLLQRVGGRYRFLHVLLRDHFAGIEPAVDAGVSGGHKLRRAPLAPSPQPPTTQTTKTRNRFSSCGSSALHVIAQAPHLLAIAAGLHVAPAASAVLRRVEEQPRARRRRAGADAIDIGGHQQVTADRTTGVSGAARSPSLTSAVSEKPPAEGTSRERRMPPGPRR